MEKFYPFRFGLLPGAYCSRSEPEAALLCAAQKELLGKQAHRGSISIKISVDGRL
jgi:hypothetical protein